MIGAITSDEKGNVLNALSAYQPNDAIKSVIFNIKKAYQEGRNVQDKPFEEFNNKSLIQRMNEDQRAWLSYSPEPYQGEDDWRWNGIRPITRNRVISTAAHLTQQLIFPNIFAQNQGQEEDRQSAHVMRDLIEYNIKRSNYETAFLFGVISGLVNPVAYFKVDYVRGLQKIWNDGKREQVVDDVLSGFQNSLVPTEDILIGNPYQFEIQKQDWIIEKTYISYGEAQAECGDYPQFQYVQPGKSVILHDDGLFYDVENEEMELVERIIYKNRRNDEQIKIVGGVYFGNDNTEYNPIEHRNNKNKPRYNIVKFGYEPVDAMRFFYYKSLVSKMSNDQEAADREWQMYFDSTFLATFPPTVTMGAGKIDRSVIAPATNTDIPMEAKIQPLQIANPNFALGALREAERSINESSQDPQSAGVQQGPQKTARESVLLQQNAETGLGLASKMIGFMVKDIGQLMVDDIIRYQTIGEMSEITGDMSYQTFLLGGKVKGGKEKTTYIKFTDRFAGKKMTEKQRKMEEYKLMEKAGDDKEIYEVNPGAFSRLEFLIQIDADRMMQKNDAFERAFKLETYDRAMANPLIQQDPEAMNKITRDFLLEPLVRGEASKYLPQVQKVASSLVPTSGKKTDMPSRMVQSAGMEKLLA